MLRAQGDNMLKPTIGCEVHVELKTESKLFCSCENSFGGAPNTRCCPVCAGLPGALPVINARALEYAVRAGLALHSDISRKTRFDRKNFFYPDLPNGWQTSQYYAPICTGGYAEYVSDGKIRRVGIARIQLEDDAGKLVRDGDRTLIDYNRCGVPLIEIVTEPDLHSAKDTVAFLKALKSVLEFTGISDLKMQEGSLRCDVNVSVAAESAPPGTRTETKNLGSFRAVARAVDAEISRQTEIVTSGGAVACETRGFDESAGTGYTLRAKERAADYMFFAEPDIPPIEITDEFIDRIRRELPESRASRVARYVGECGLSAYDAEVITADFAVSELFQNVTALGIAPKRAANFISGEVLRLMATHGDEIGVSPSALAEILRMTDNGTLGNLAAKRVLAEVWGRRESPSDAAARLRLLQMSDGEVAEALRSVLADRADIALGFSRGDEKLRGYLIGELMRVTNGRANPVTANRLLDEYASYSRKE